MTDPKPLVLVDGSSYLFRAFHALPPLVTSKGQPTGAIKGVANMLLALIKQYQPERMAVVFDAKGKTFRHDLYEAYKANRPPMPDELASQIEPLHELVRAMGLPLIIEEGIEADDVIGTLATQAAEQGMPVVISTGDKDMAQLVNDRVSLINTMSNEFLDVAGVQEKFGVRPDQIIDYLTLVGDKVDNIPGVNKCGPKTAVKWLEQYGSLDNLMAHADEIKGKIGEYLREALPQLPLSKDLATIRTDCPLKETLDDLVPGKPDHDAMQKLFRELEFKSWLADMQGGKSPVAAAFGTGEEAVEAVNAGGAIDRTGYEIIADEAQLKQWLDAVVEAGVFALDTETTSLYYMEAELVGLSIALLPGKAAYIPVAHQVLSEVSQLSREWVLEQFRPILENPAILKIGQNLKYDRHILQNHDIALNGIRWDTMLESYVLDAAGSRHDMDTLSLKYLGHKPISFEELAGKGAKQKRFDELEIEAAAEYAAEDADITLQLHQVMWPKLEAEPGLKKVFDTIEMPLLPVIQKIERNGAYVDAAMLAEQSRELSERLEAIEQQAHQIAGESFNLSSPKQLGEILYTKLGIKPIKKTAKGAPSTAEAVLVELAHEHELPRVILEYRGLAKLKSTYTDKLPRMIDPRTGRIHTSYHQAVTATGRLSSTDPNLQNIPVRTEEGRKIRQAFRAEPGNRILAADYSQIELRIMAHLSRDEGLLKAFREGLDVHRATAAEVWGVDLDAVTREQRSRAKAINFGLIYGMSSFGLARQLGISRSEAQDYINVYFERYPGVLQYMESTRTQAREQGYVETLFGRRLYLPEIRDRNPMRRQAAERTAINAPMQGTAADIIKRAMIAVDRLLEEAHPQVRMIMQVHDELVFELPETQVESVQEKIVATMEQAAELSVPLLVDVGVGNSWDEAH